MRYLFWLLKAAIFLLLFIFALHNRHDVVMHLLFGYTLTVPVMVIVLCSFAIGSLAGIVVMLPRCWRYKKAAAQAQATVAQPAQGDDSGGTLANPAETGRHMTDPSITIPYGS